jgi:hypothetical protein
VPRTAPLPTSRRPSAWGLLVAVSAFVVLGAISAVLASWALSSERRIGTYEVRGAINGVRLDLDAADARIVGADDDAPVRVRRTDSYAFGREPLTERQTVGGVLRIRVRCPETLLGTCSSAYRVAVPANVPVTVRTSTGDVRFSGYRGSASIDTDEGDIDVTAYCGFLLRARARTGDVQATAACAPDRLELRSQEGSIDALVPAGRYQIDADSDGGTSSIEGLENAVDAPFRIQALSGSGDVRVGAGS